MAHARQTWTIRGAIWSGSIKQLSKDPACIAEAEGRVVKVISRLLLSLPEGHEYRVIFMQRPLREVLASQEVMLDNRGTAKPGTDNSVIAAAFERHLREVHAWLDKKDYVKTLRVPYHEALRDAEGIGQKLSHFLEIGLNLEALARQVDATLYRNRSR
jgi:hypothetical protein